METAREAIKGFVFFFTDGLVPRTGQPTRSRRVVTILDVLQTRD